MIEPPDDATVADRVAAVRDRIAAAGGQDVTLVAVTKGFSEAAVVAALAAGVTDVGESYAQEMATKVSRLNDRAADARWHFIGRLQRNKVRLIAGSVACWQSVDRPELVDEIARRAPGARVLIQVNLSGDPAKGGCAWQDVAVLVARGQAAGLAVEGLMGVAPAGPTEAARPGFRRLVALSDELGLPERSIGMSGDLAVAVEEGATIVRVGEGLFGARPPRH